MNHLLSFLLRGQSLGPFLLLIAACIVGGLGATLLLLRRQAGLKSRLIRAVAFIVLAAGTNYIVFLLGLTAGFPRLRLSLPTDAGLTALGITVLTAGIASSLLLFRPRSIRLLLLAGAMVPSGLSLTIFTGMAALVRPFRLGYDLNVVISTELLSIVLCGFAFSEMKRRVVRRRLHPPIILFALSLLVTTIGSLGSILPLDQWITVMENRDSLSAFPVPIILASDIVLVAGMVLTGWGIDSLLAMQDQREVARVRRLADSTFEGILIHRDHRILDANERLLLMTGYTLTELRSKTASIALKSLSMTGGDQAGKAGTPRVAQIQTKDGETLPVEVLARDIDYVGGPARVVAVRDIRERSAMEQRIHHLANHDALTDLPNRRHLEFRFHQASAIATREGARMAICCIDLDGFKGINDRHGHAIGDLLLRKVADLLRAECRGGDLAARLGGDEFVILLEPGDRSNEAYQLGNRLVDALAQPLALEGIVVNIGASIGLSFFPEDGETVDSLFRAADIALYRAKERGRNQICVFESGMDRRVLERRALEQDLRKAIAAESMSLQYQPLFDRAGNIVGFEALVRWCHPEIGAIPPDQFIPLAERSGLILELGAWVLFQACQEAAGWEDSIRIAVNLSPAQFRYRGLVEEIDAALRESGLRPDRLEVEITEGVLIDDAKQAVPILRTLRDMGIRVVLDDFGTGYSSLGYLHSFPFDKIKIDRAFVSEIESDRKAFTIVDSLIAMSHKLDLTVAAEGIETEMQLGILREHGCDEMQGFLLGRPMAAEAIPQFMVSQAEQRHDDRKIMLLEAS